MKISTLFSSSSYLWLVNFTHIFNIFSSEGVHFSNRPRVFTSQLQQVMDSMEEKKVGIIKILLNLNFPQENFEDFTNSVKGQLDLSKLGQSTTRSIGNSVNRQLGQSTTRSIGNSVNWQLGQSVTRSIGNSINRQSGQLTNRSIGNSVNRQSRQSINWSIDKSVNRQIGLSATPSIDNSVKRQIVQSKTRSIANSAHQLIIITWFE